MNTTEKDILATLIELEKTIAAFPTLNPRPSLLPLFQRIDQLTAELPRGTDPGLLHYLHKKSYEKARMWLQGREEENAPGSCRH